MSAKLWKEKPPGPEQKELERMFTSKEIDPREQPDSVRKRNDMFKGFSAAVFASHYRKTRAKLGLSARVSRIEDEDEIVDLGTYVRDRSRSPIDMMHSSNGTTDETQPVPKQRFSARHSNPPCWTWIYTDHERKKDYVCVAMPALTGSKANFTISECGQQVTVKYDWPNVMFKAAKLFERSHSRDGQILTLSHPKVHAFVSHLYDIGVTENSTIKGEFIVDLPRKVQREIDSWTLEKVIIDDTKMILMEFTAFQKALDINDANTSLDF